MVDTIVKVAMVLGAYLLGSIPTGVLVAQARGIDLRAVGSGNIGATNAARALGRPLGAVVFLGDLLKGAAPVLLARHLALSPTLIAQTGFAAFAGHLFPLYLWFRGGKGIATAAGIFFVMAPIATALALAGWIILLIPWRFVSVASIGAAALLPLLLLLLGEPAPIWQCALGVFVLVTFKHRKNLVRLFRHEEPKI